MTRLDCAIRLLRCLRSFDNCDSRDVEAFARAIMELGRNEMKEGVRSEKMQQRMYSFFATMDMGTVLLLIQFVLIGKVLFVSWI